MKPPTTYPMRLLRATTVAGQVRAHGAVVDVDAATAAAWLRAGQAVLVDSHRLAELARELGRNTQAVPELLRR